jgi:hypothetical protein
MIASVDVLLNMVVVAVPALLAGATGKRSCFGARSLTLSLSFSLSMADLQGAEQGAVFIWSP